MCGAGWRSRYSDSLLVDVPGSNPGWSENFRTLPYRPCVPPSLLYSEYRVSFPGLKRPGRGVYHPHKSSAEVKERVQLYLYSPSGPSCPILGWTPRLPLALIQTTWQKDRTKCREVSTRLQSIASQTSSLVVSTVARSSKLPAIGPITSTSSLTFILFKLSKLEEQ
jgi:hypothetical protein